MKNVADVMIIFVCIAVLFACSPAPLHSIEYEMQLTVVDTGAIGLNVENDKLYFGKVPQGEQSTRYIQVRNNLTRTTSVIFSTSGPAAQFISVPENGYVLQPGEERVFLVQAQTKQATPTGNYTGKLVIAWYLP